MDAVGISPSQIKELTERLAGHSWQLGFAESCTGGLLSSWITQHPGVSRFFRGSVISYAGQVKTDVLGVSSASMRALGEVSELVARQMAVGARRALDCDWAVAITGVAGPSGGSPEKPVGTVCFAVVGPGFERVTTQSFSPALSRREIQQRSALFAFEMLLTALR